MLCGCESKGAGRIIDTNDQPKIVEASDASVVQVPHPERFPLVPVELRNETDELKVTGTVSPDVSLAVPVGALVSGRVSEIRARLGDSVHQGDVLLIVNSPDLAVAFQDYQKFKADEALSRSQLERAQLLYDHGAMARKDVEIVEEVYTKAQVDTRVTAERIRLLGGDPDRVSHTFQIRAPATGVITEQNVTATSTVKTPDNQPNLFTISDLSTVWVLCDVFENNLAQVKLGETAQVQLNAYPERLFDGQISNISSLLDPATRTAKVRVVLKNPSGILRPGMFATVTFFSPGGQKRAFVPATAVLRLHDRDWVFVPEGGHFRRIEIHTAAVTKDGFQRVVSGIDPGMKVVKYALQFSSTADNNS